MRKEKDIFYENREELPSVRALLERAGEKFPNEVFCRWNDKSGKICEVKYQKLIDDIHAISGWLIDNQMLSCHAALIGETCYEWIATYFSLISTGVVAATLDRLQTKEELNREATVAEAKMIFYTKEYAEKAQYIAETSGIAIYELSDANVFAEMCAGDPARSADITIDPKALAEIVFTSGTTGVAKGVMLSHENIISAVMFGVRLVDIEPGETLLSIMPNNHTYELSIGMLTPTYFGMTIAIGGGLKQLMSDFKTFKPGTMLVVPALLKAIRSEVFHKLQQQNKMFIFKAGMAASRVLCAVGIDIRRKLFDQIYQAFGGRVKSLICGGAYLSDELIDFYERIGIHIIQGYGLTECSPIVSCNTDRNVGERSLGKIGPYCEVKSEDGELMVRGKNVMMGYYKDPEQTAEVLKDGWFYTGDLGYVDEDGFLYLTGRKKNLIILGNGENVSPEGIENILGELEFVSNVMVYGENELIVAEIFPDYEFFKTRGISNIQSYAETEIKKLNAGLPDYQRIAVVKIRDHQFERTTTLKNKR